MRRTLAAISLALTLSLAMHAQSKAPVQPADYGQFESLSMSRDFGGLSPDGK